MARTTMKHPMRSSLPALLLPALLAAQQDGGDLVATDYSTNSVYRITPAGVVTTLLSGLSSPSGIAVTANQEVLVLETTGALKRLPRFARLQTVATGLATPIRIAVDHDGTYVVTSLGSKALLRITTTGTVSTIYSGAPLVRPFGVAVDSNGDYLVTDDSTNALYRITRAGALSTIWSGAPFALPQGVALWGNGDYAVIDGTTDSVYRIARAGGPPQLVVAPPAIGNPDGIHVDFEGRVLVSQSGTANRIDLVEPNGKVTPIASGAPFQNLEALARVPQLYGPITGGPGLTTKLGLSFPGQGGHLYALWASLSLHPGLPLGGGDTRWIAGNPDALFLASLGANDAVFVAWVGALSTTGTGSPSLVVPQIQLPPLTLYVQALTMDLQQPGPIVSLSNVHVLKL